MNATSDDIIEQILSIIKSKHHDIHTKLFGSYDSSACNDNDIKRRRETLISHGNEALRILDSKRVYLGNKENRTIRAALVIDYLVRNIRSHDNSHTDNSMYFRSSIPMQTLMSILGLKNNRKKDFENMQTLLGSYLDKTAIAARITSSGDGSNSQNTMGSLRKRSADGTTVASVNSNAIDLATSNKTTTTTSLIRDLCINLGPLITDADFVFKYATKLFYALANNANVKKNQREQDWLRQDMNRFLDCYEGACFYLAVKESEGGNYNDVLKKKARAKLTLKNQQKKEEVKTKNTDDGGRREDGSNNHHNNGDQDDGGDDQDDEDDTDDDRPMNEMDVVMAACLSEGTFKTVLDYVKKYAQDIVISLDDTTDQKMPAKKKKGGAKNDASAVNRFGGRSVIVESNINSGKSMRHSGNNTEFERWKRKVLDATTARMQTKHKISREEALKCAAEEIVRDSQKTS